jgi:preprotein translocase subunit SecE
MIFLTEVRAEVRKVTWPTPEEIRKATGVIVVFVSIIGAIIGLMDWILSRVLIMWIPRLFGG